MATGVKNKKFHFKPYRLFLGQFSKTNAKNRQYIQLTFFRKKKIRLLYYYLPIYQNRECHYNVINIIYGFLIEKVNAVFFT